MRFIDCRKFGRKVCVRDFVGKYGDWLFKQPLIFALEKAGLKISVLHNLYPPLVHGLDSGYPTSAEWIFAFTRDNRGKVWAKYVQQHKSVIEIRRISRFTESVNIWKKGVLISARKFRADHEQERIRSIARYLGLSYRERSVSIIRRKKRVFAINMNVGENVEHRLNFDFQQIYKLVNALRKQGCKFKVIKDISRSNAKLKEFYAKFNDSEISKVKNFQQACRIIDHCDYYFGADSGLAHYAVESGKITFALYSLVHHGKKPLFQSTFQNHLCYFGDTLFSDKLFSDFERINKMRADKKLLKQIAQFLEYGKGINIDPYSNERKVFALFLTFLSQNEYRKKLARMVHANSASIFFTDEVVGLNIKELTPVAGKIFVDPKSCARAIHSLIASYPNSSNISFYAKPCSFFYGTALRDGSSDLDLPTIRLQGRERRKSTLLKEIEHILKKFNFCTDLPHQTPIISTRTQSLRPLIKNGRITYSLCCQEDKHNLLKYEARIKMKIIVGEMSRTEEQELKILLHKTADGQRLLEEIEFLKQDSRYFKKWEIFIRKIIKATQMLGDFGAKGHVFLKIEKQDCLRIGEYINGLTRHGIMYGAGVRLYPLWNIRRPQHGWYQPITILTEDLKLIQKNIKRALKSPVYKSKHMRPLKLLSVNKLVVDSIVPLLESPNPLIVMEAYRSIASHNVQFKGKTIFSREELRAYAFENQSNCDNPRDRKLSLWSLATGLSLPLSCQERRHLTKYNCFVQFFTRGANLDISKTRFFKTKMNTDISEKDFVKPFIKRMIRLIREYYLYTLAVGLPKEYLYEKKKEILYVYFVQGRTLLEGPRAQSQKAEQFLRKFNIENILFDGRVLRGIINSWPITIQPPLTEFFLSWLIRQNKSEEILPGYLKNNQINQMVLPFHRHLYRSVSVSDI